MAINDIKYSQLPELLEASVTDATVFSVVESDGNFRLSFAAIKALTAFDMTVLDPLSRDEIDGTSLLHMFSTINGNVNMEEFLSYTSRLTLLPAADDTDLVPETEFPIHFNGVGKKVTFQQIRDMLPLNYSYNRLEDPLLDVGDVYEVILSHTIVDAVAGDYELKASFVSEFSDINDGMSVRFTGASDSPEFYVNTSGVDIIPWSYGFPYAHPGGNLTLTLEAKKDVGATQLNFLAANIIFDQKSFA